MLAYAKALLVELPVVLKLWLQQFMALFAVGGSQQLILGVLKGSFDTLLLIFLGTSFVAGGQIVMNSQYTLPASIQTTALKWAPVADNIARDADIPREVPLVLWFKESSMQAVNPDNCIGIVGAYDLVRSGSQPCFTPGPISDLEVARQLAIGAQEFKKRCPDITYYTQSPETIKRCYFAYNAGMGAAARLDPDQSAYVMNNYSEAHTNMIYSDIELGTVVVKQLGAWPTHLALQSLVVSQLDMAGGGKRPLSIAVLDLSTRLYDWATSSIQNWGDIVYSVDGSMPIPASRQLAQENCIGKAHTFGNPVLRPRLNPVTVQPILTQDVHGCSYSLPGIDISSNDSTAILQATMPGDVTTYTDQWYNTTIRIENDEWIVWMLHPRSYIVESGTVRRGQPVGVMGAVGYATGPHVHYTIFDKVNDTFVDPLEFLP
jgi:hypothetical protein